MRFGVVWSKRHNSYISILNLFLISERTQFVFFNKKHLADTIGLGCVEPNELCLLIEITLDSGSLKEICCYMIGNQSKGRDLALEKN